MKRTSLFYGYIVSIYIVALLFFGLFRGVLLFNHTEQIAEVSNKASMILQAFWMGFRFDTVISCYILLTPIVLGFFFSLFQYFPKALFKGIFIFTCIVFSIAMLVCAANIPYFNVFFKNINASIWNWIDEPAFVTEMILKESSFFIYLIVYLIINFLFCFLLYKVYKYFWGKVFSMRKYRRLNACFMCCYSIKFKRGKVFL